MILDSLLVGTMLFTSFAMRTPNVQPNPDDYEVSIGLYIFPFHSNGVVSMIMLTIMFVGCLLFAYLIEIESKKYPK